MENKSWQASRDHLVWLRISFLLIHARCKHHVALASVTALRQTPSRWAEYADALCRSNELMRAMQP